MLGIHLFLRTTLFYSSEEAEHGGFQEYLQ